MARKKDIQYVRFYTHGAAAPRVERRQEQQVINHPAQTGVKRIPLAFDPIAVIGTTVAVVMLVCVLIGFAQLSHASGQVQEMETYISSLKAENNMLKTEYAHGYNLEEVRVTAISMGMIPMDHTQRITVSLPEEEPEPELSWWEEFWMDLKELFA